MSVPEIKYDHFYPYDEMTAFLAAVCEEYSDLVAVDDLLTTLEGRKVSVVTVTDPSTGKAEDKPAYYIQAGLHAQEGAGTTAAFHFLSMLLTDDSCRALLKEMTFYLIPRVNPDGTEYSLTHRARHRSCFKIVERKNGLVPEDINGDGMILQMRWQDPAGPMKVDPVDSRLMVPREPGDEGPFYQVMCEGIVQDYDGGPIVDGTWLIDFNRNWPTRWDSGFNGSYYPFSEPEVRAVADFLIAHPNIFAGIDFHCGNNAVFLPFMDANSEVDQNDLEQILAVGKRGEEIIGFPLMHQRFDYCRQGTNPRRLCGIGTDWAYHVLGIAEYIIELGNGFNDAGISTREYHDADEQTRQGEMMRRVIAFHDSVGSKLFEPWKECSHPQLGSVEVGGILHGCGYFMWPGSMEAIAPKTTAFLFEHAKRHPQLEISNAAVERVDGDVCCIRATVANIGGSATRGLAGGGAEFMQHPVRARLVPGDGVEIVNRVTLHEIENLPAHGGSAQLEWFVRGLPGAAIIITARHPRGGVVSQELAL